MKPEIGAIVLKPLGYASSTNGGKVQHTDVFTNKMQRSARMAAMTGRVAAFDMAAKVWFGPIIH